jgi:hypothetical protein
VRDKKLTLLPGPDDDLDTEEPDPGVLIIDDDEDDRPDDQFGDGPGQVPAWLDVDPRPEPEPDAKPTIPIDKPPGRLAGKKGRGGKTPKAAPAPPPKITANIRKDVQAKIRIVLQPAANVWNVRDPFCGRVAVQQEPDVSAALAAIVCDSPDLLAFFTGPAGGFMKYFELFMALWPVLMAVQAHHIAHAVKAPGGDPVQPPQAPAFAA